MTRLYDQRFSLKVTLFWSITKTKTPWGKEILNLCGMVIISLKRFSRQVYRNGLNLKEMCCWSLEMGYISRSIRLRFCPSILFVF